FPDDIPPTVDAALPAEATEAIAASEFQPLIGRQLEGDRGIYQIEQFLGQRGNGLVFVGKQLDAQQSVTIKVYTIASSLFNDAEARQRQRAFTNLAGLNLTSERSSDFRVLRPLEAIADGQTSRHCYLVTAAADASPRLSQILQQRGPLPPEQVRQILEQVLQTLTFLHQQQYILPAGHFQTGVVHGNLNLDNLLWVDYQQQPFIYLTDLMLWERFFDSTSSALPSCQVTPKAIAQDLHDLGQISFALLTGQHQLPVDPEDPAHWPQQDLELEQFSRRLLGQAPAFSSAEGAWQAMLLLNQVKPATPVPPLITEANAPQQRRGWLWALSSLAILATLGGVFGPLLLRQLRATSETLSPLTCCFKDISAVPAGQFSYTAIDQGSWSYAWNQNNLEQAGQSLQTQLAQAHPTLQLNTVVSGSVADAIARVQSGEVEFAILPMLQALPLDLEGQVIAYDGLALVVAFAYAKRQDSLPEALNGTISLQNIQALYLDELTNWNLLGGPDLKTRLYASQSPEALSIFAERVFQVDSISKLPFQRMEFFTPIGMLQKIIQDFEIQPPSGSIGFVPLSAIASQCSVYPLALKNQDSPPVQALVLDTGQPITPATDLCRQKGAYGPDLEVFQSGKYPLAYPISVVFPRDNSRSTVGQKFADLLTTQEGQTLLRSAGLIPIQTQLSPQSTHGGRLTTP
ncbi:MAG: phosphate ABC transporter substrate-binding protein, partial [Cyanobacteria bacterium P01_H01_bin.121]